MSLPREIAHAALNGDLDTVRQFVESNPECVNEEVEGGDSDMYLLGIAVLIQSTEMVRYLISRGADVECRNKKTAPLHVACTITNTELVALLLQAGANVHRIDEEGSAITNCLINNQNYKRRDIVQVTDRIYECLRHLLRAGLALNLLEVGTAIPLEQIIEDIIHHASFVNDEVNEEDLSEFGGSLDLVRAVRASVYTSASSRICPWRQYVLAPSVAVLRFRSLFFRGRARVRGVVSGPTPRPIAWLLTPQTPREIVWNVLAFWNPRYE